MLSGIRAWRGIERTSPARTNTARWPAAYYHLPCPLDPDYSYAQALDANQDETHMRVSYLSLAGLVAASTLSAASYVTVNCGSPSGLPVSVTSTATSTSCSSFDGGTNYSSGNHLGGSAASGSVVLTLADNPAEYSLLTTSQNAVAVQASPPELTLGRGTAATIVISYSSTITTGGLERQGYLQISPDSTAINQSYYSGGSQMTSGLDINPIVRGVYYDPNRPVTEVACATGYTTTGCNPSPNYLQNYTPLIAITLGVPITLVADGSTYDYVNAGEGMSGGGLSTTFGFRFLEADRTTPVQAVAAAPEPSTWASLAGGLAALALWKSRSPRQKQIE